MTIERLIYEFLRWKPGSYGMTASQMHKAMNECGHSIKLNSLSSSLAKMVKSGKLVVLPEFGPRKGNGYILAPE